MISISESLLPAHVTLDIQSSEMNSAVTEVMGKLDGDPRVVSFSQFLLAVHDRATPPMAVHGVGICLAHGRSASVQTLVFAAGRSAVGISVPSQPEKVRLLFVAGIPAAMNSEYLRSVGLLVRLCQDVGTLEKLLEAPTPAAFLAILSGGETRL